MPTARDYLVVPDPGLETQYLYSCSSCCKVLDVRKKLVPPEGILDAFTGTCPSCGAKLENSIDCRLGQAPAEWRDPRPPVQKAAARPKAPVFQRASSYNRFSLDFARLDSLLQPLSPDNLVMLEGQGASAVAELAAFRAQLPRERGGLDSTTVFVDGGNCSDPYLFSSLARRYSLDTRRALRRVSNCRVFTMYQLASLLSDEVVGMAEAYGSKLVVIANILGTFNEPDTSDREAGRLLDAIHAGIREARKGKLTVMVTLGTPTKYDGTVAGWSDTLVRLSPSRGGRTRAELLRHPAKRQGSAEFAMDRLLFNPDSPLEAVR